MSRLSLGVDSRKIFGEYLPSVFIEKVLISNPPDEVTGLPNIEGTTYIDTRMSIAFEKPPDYDGDMSKWVSEQYENLYLCTILSPFEDLNTSLEESNLSMWKLYSAVSATSPSLFTSSWPGFNPIINYMKEFFINNWLDSEYSEGETDGIPWTDTDRRAGLDDLGSDIAERFWGRTGPDSDAPLNTEGPWSSTGTEPSFIGSNIGDFLSFIEPTLSSTHWGKKTSFIKLSDLASGTGGEGGSEVITEGYYDNNGNEIVKIENIKIRLEYDTETVPVGITDRLNNTKKLFLISSVVHGDIDATSTPPHLFNSCFGDISYEHILEYNQVPDQTEVLFAEIESGEYFNGKPIQSFDRKYFVPHPVDQSIIVTSLENLIKNMEPWEKTDKRLKKATTQLKALLLDNSTATDLLVQLKKFSIALPHKDFGSPPGQFFKSLQEIINAFNESVTKQLQLSKNLVYNVTVIDERPPPLKSTYAPPSSPDLDPTMSDDYIPSSWSMMSRYAEQTIPVKGLLTDFVEFAMAEGFDADYTVPDGDGGAPITVSDEEKLGRAIEAWEYYNSSFGYSDENVRDGIDIRGDTVVANKGIWFFDYEKALYTRSTISAVFNVRKLQDLFHYTVPYEYFFCSEARMTRREAELDLNNSVPAEEDGFTGHVPDDSVKIKLTTSMWDGGSSEAMPPRWPMSRWCTYQYDTSNLKYGQPFVYTFGNVSAAGTTIGGIGDRYTDYSGDTITEIPMFESDLPTSGDTPSSGDLSSPERSMFGIASSSEGWSIMEDFMEWIDESSMGSGDAEDYSSMKSLSFLKYVCFDVCNPEYSERLEGFGNYDLPNFRTENPIGPRGTYRMLAFQYRDYMDDDVAYYNTWGSFYGGRNGEYIAQLVLGADFVAPSAEYPEGSDFTEDTYTSASKLLLNDVWTGYTYAVDMRDRTVKVIDDIYEVGKDALDELIKYQNLANEICSYNNITGAFNEFFTEGIMKYYPEDIKPWVQAAYVYNALRELLFASFSAGPNSPTNMEKLLEDSRIVADSIGPINGTVANIDSFVTKLKLVLHNIYPQEGYSGGYGAAVIYRAWVASIASDFGSTSASTFGGDPDLLMEEMKKAWRSEVHTKFTNHMPITKMIYGNLALAAYWEDGYGDYVPPSCEASYMDPEKTLSERLEAWLGCISYSYRVSLPEGAKTWVRSASGGDSERSGEIFGTSATTKLYSVYKWTMVTVCFLNEFQDLITEYYHNDLAGWMVDDKEASPFYNKDRFEEFFSGDPWNLDTLSPWSDFEITWLEIFSRGMKYLSRFNDIDYGDLTDSWIPTSSWNQGFTGGARTGSELDTPWRMVHVTTSESWLREYAGSSWSDDDEAPPDPDYWKLPAFYWLEWEEEKRGNRSVSEWKESDGGFSGSLDDSFPFEVPAGLEGAHGVYWTDDDFWTSTGSYDTRTLTYNWLDQFQFDIGIISTYQTLNETGIAINGVPLAPPKVIDDPS